MKLCSLFILAMNTFLVTSALPSRMWYYTGQSSPLTNGMMYVQYMQPRQYRNVAAGGVAAFSSGDTVASGSYLNDCEDEKHTENGGGRRPPKGAVSIAEAYPQEEYEVHGITDNIDQPEYVPDSYSEQPQLPEQPDHPQHPLQPVQPIAPEYHIKRQNRKGGNGIYNSHFPGTIQTNRHDDDSEEFLPSTTISYYENEITSKNDLPSTTVIPVPAKFYTNAPKIPSKKKIQVRLDYPEDDYRHNPIPPPRPEYLPNRGGQKPTPSNGDETGYAVSKGGKGNQPQMGGPFFPIYFGGETGGSAIAIANSYSTGESGSATSHAVAYGNPAGNNGGHRKAYHKHLTKRQ